MAVACAVAVVGSGNLAAAHRVAFAVRGSRKVWALHGVATTICMHCFVLALNRMGSMTAKSSRNDGGFALLVRTAADGESLHDLAWSQISQ